MALPTKACARRATSETSRAGPCRSRHRRKIIRRAASGEFGWAKVEVIEPSSRLLRGLSPVFGTFQAHQDEVAELPQGTLRFGSIGELRVWWFARKKTAISDHGTPSSTMVLSSPVPWRAVEPPSRKS